MNLIDQKAAELTEARRNELGQIEVDVLTNFTLADAIRMGSTVSEQAYNWGDGARACSLTAAVIAARSLGYL